MSISIRSGAVSLAIVQAVEFILFIHEPWSGRKIW